MVVTAVRVQMQSLPHSRHTDEAVTEVTAAAAAAMRVVLKRQSVKDGIPKLFQMRVLKAQAVKDQSAARAAMVTQSFYINEVTTWQS